jgi:hypothetical protein
MKRNKVEAPADRVRFKLRFPIRQIQTLAARYPAASDSTIEDTVAPAARQRGYLTKPEFLALCEWKSPRTRPRCASNPEDFIVAVTSSALGTANERLRIEILTLLNGVSWPTASVILHFCARDPYPVLDVRALWSLSVPTVPRYDYALWAEYTRFSRELATRAGVSLRQLDRALWQYSTEKPLARADR